MRSIHNIGLTFVLAALLAIGAATNNVVGAALVDEGIQAAPPAADEGACRFTFGFQTLHDLIPATVGDCVENETHNNVNGDGLQRTTRGLLVWRKADNFTAFTDGYRTWVNGSQGPQQRLNSERFAWEDAAQLSPSDIALNPPGSATSWRAVYVPATPYDASQPPGPKGLPAHIEILFGAGEKRQPNEPVMYIIPVEAYRQLWSEAGNPGVANVLPRIASRVNILNAPGGVAALPFEELAGANDLAVKIGRTAPVVQTGATSAAQSGYRFVGRWAQDANPVTNRNLRYVYQGFTNDGRYLVTFFHPITADKLPSVEAVSPEEMNRLSADYQGYMAERTAFLNGLESADFSPSLASLDALVASLTIRGVPTSGLQNRTWQWVRGPAQPGSATIVTVDRPERYQVTYASSGRAEFVADCNRGSLSYELRQGGLAGSLLVGQGAFTLAACGPESHSQGFVAGLRAAQNYRIEPGGNRMTLILPAGGGTLEFVAAP